MPLSVRELAEFYDGHLGAVTRRILLRRLRQIWPNVEGLRLLGFGYATPYLRPFLLEAERGVIKSLPAVVLAGLMKLFFVIMAIEAATLVVKYV